MLKIGINFAAIICSLCLVTSGCSVVNGTADESTNEFVCNVPEGTESADTKAVQILVSSLDSKGDQRFSLGQYDNAFVCYSDALKVREQSFGTSHLSVVDSLVNLATFHEVNEEYKKAINLYKRAQQILKRHYPMPNKSVKTIQGYQAAIRYQLTDRDSLEKTRNSLIAYRQIFGSNNIFVGVTEHRLANLYLQNENYSEAEKSIRNAEVMIIQNIGADHPYYAKLLLDKARLMHLTNRGPLADELNQKADSILKKFPKKTRTPLYQK